jgi:hypothetical protein
MSIAQDKKWITGEEFGRERRRLIEAGVPNDAPEFQELICRVVERDDYLYETYGKPYLGTHRGKWIAVSLDGQVVIRDRSGELIWDAVAAFGRGNFSMRKLAVFPGHTLLS